MIRSVFLIWLAARREWGALGDLDGDDGWTTERWFEALTPYFEQYGSIEIGGEARNPGLVVIAEQADRWDVRQVILDPDDDRSWSIRAEVDLAASDAEGEAVVHVRDVAPT